MANEVPSSREPPGEAKGRDEFCRCPPRRYDPPMTEAEIAKLATWLAKAGLEGRTETALVEGFCSRAVAGGLPLARVMMLVDTLHPIHEGRAFRWESEKPEATLTEYGRTSRGGGGRNAGAQVLFTGF